MGMTQPIKKIEEVVALKEYFFNKGEFRNFALVTLGLNTSMRIGDLLLLRWKDVFDFNSKTYKEHILITEQKTGKKNTLALNSTVIKALDILKNSSEKLCENDFIFKSRCGGNKPLGRTQAFYIVKEAADELHLEGNISCHSLRKTFGYHAWKQGVPTALIMSIYNHSSIEITKRYLSIDQDDKDDVFLNIKL